MMPPLVWHPHYAEPLRRDSRFPMSKSGYLRALLAERGLMPASGGYLAPGPASLAQIARAHAIGYAERVFAGALAPAEERRIGLAITPAITLRARLSAAGTLLAARLALEQGLAMHLAGGGHHAGPEGGAGYCVFNDVAVAARALRDEVRVGRILVVDLDVHQGDGTARILEGEPGIFTLSLHAERNFPARKATSSLDIGFADGTRDGPYLEALDTALGRALAAGRPDLAFYNAGVDPAAGDRLGRLALSRAGLAARDRLVLARLRQAEVPVATVLGGGYGESPEEVAGRHAILFEEAAGLNAM